MFIKQLIKVWKIILSVLVLILITIITPPIILRVVIGGFLSLLLFHFLFLFFLVRPSCKNIKKRQYEDIVLRNENDYFKNLMNSSSEDIDKEIIKTKERLNKEKSFYELTKDRDFFQEEGSIEISEAKISLLKEIKEGKIITCSFCGEPIKNQDRCCPHCDRNLGEKS